MKAVIPAAGLGIRFLPMTKDQPKEMLPVVNKPTIQYVVEEAIDAGITDITIITGRGKGSIEDYFDRYPDLELFLKEHGKTKELEDIQRISSLADIFFIRQKYPAGLGDAVHLAKDHVGNEPFAVMLGDTINISKVPVIKQLIDVHKRTGCSVIAVEPVEKENIQDYGIIKGDKITDTLFRINDLVEKPGIEDAPSNLGITGSYILTPEIFDCIERTKPGKNGEIQLTDSIRMLLQDQDIYGQLFEGRRYDVGDMLKWIKTNIELALDDPKFGPELLPFIGHILGKRPLGKISKDLLS
jgi:UTP--glucose-1-phosphate uridylyltransferase